MFRREFENYPKEVEELLLQIVKAPRKYNTTFFIKINKQEKPLLLPSPKE